ncbi:hypothetical protein [Methylobacterium sp. 10]|uniref:hypothetical protein n=1 Tax=Methylobacterium sp. 10 TaxID=1101191 RepID=UPI000488E754|nr:hypothetical protein [Methylobacterium sp. 10]
MFQTSADVEIVRAVRADRIQLSRGNTVIEGTRGGDKMFSGSGSDTISFKGVSRRSRMCGR